MRDPHQLSQGELAAVVEQLQQILYLGHVPGVGFAWDPDRAWDADTLDAVGQLLADHRLGPDAGDEGPAVNIDVPQGCAVRKGDSVRYRDPATDQVRTAVCTGHGRKGGERIHLLGDGGWCYRRQVLGVTRAPRKRPPGQ
jgi:hypothetical protein